ncbi:MAG: MerR family transcriptional regulator [Firmicutes bacterium]|nr:MerR family transcriptional regulator [Bacillota bacterium]
MKLKINELSKLLGITSMTLRRYEQHGYISPERDAADYRWYNDKDIIKMVQVRLLRKCGFSHDEIHSFLDSPVDRIKEISVNRLNEIDEQMRRLKYLRHWLKDNILLIDRISEIGDSFAKRDCPPLRYVIYGTNKELYKEKERLKTVNDFLYTVEEVQPIYILRQNERSLDDPIPYRGLAIKEQDIDRLGIRDIVENDKYIEIYSQYSCIYSILECGKTDEDEYRAFLDFNKRLEKYLAENSLEICGDIVGFILGVLGEKEHYLMCVPVEEK